MELPLRLLWPSHRILASRRPPSGPTHPYPPFESVNNQSQLAGFDVDLMNALFERVNGVAEFTTTSFDALIPGVNAGAFDVIVPPMTITVERVKQADLGVLYEILGQAIVVRPGDEHLTLQYFTEEGSGLVVGAVGSCDQRHPG